MVRTLYMVCPRTETVSGVSWSASTSIAPSELLFAEATPPPPRTSGKSRRGKRCAARAACVACCNRAPWRCTASCMEGNTHQKWNKRHGSQKHYEACAVTTTRTLPCLLPVPQEERLRKMVRSGRVRHAQRAESNAQPAFARRRRTSRFVEPKFTSLETIASDPKCGTKPPTIPTPGSSARRGGGGRRGGGATGRHTLKGTWTVRRGGEQSAHARACLR